MIISAIESHEVIYVDTIHIPGAYLHTDSDEEVIMILKGILADILEDIDPKFYRNFFC